MRGQDAHLALDAEAFANHRAQIAEDLGKVASRLALDQHGGGEELRVEDRNSLTEVAEGVGKRHAEVLPVIQKSKLRADRLGHLFGHERDSSCQRVPGA